MFLFHFVICKENLMLLVSDVMSVGLITLNPTDTLKTAREIMRRARIRHLPVLSLAGMFVGLLTQRDLLKASVSFFADVPNDELDSIEMGIPVSEIMETQVLMATPDMPLVEAGELMLTHKFGCLPVVEGGVLKGILTESDFVKLCIALLGPNTDTDPIPS
jgi:CBS domain-containing membrane protein